LDSQNGKVNAEEVEWHTTAMWTTLWDN
jgi:hypothetical protein